MEGRMLRTSRSWKCICRGRSRSRPEPGTPRRHQRDVSSPSGAYRKDARDMIEELERRISFQGEIQRQGKARSDSQSAHAQGRCAAAPLEAALLERLPLLPAVEGLRPPSSFLKEEGNLTWESPKPGPHPKNRARRLKYFRPPSRRRGRHSKYPRMKARSGRDEKLKLRSFLLALVPNAPGGALLHRLQRRKRFEEGFQLPGTRNRARSQSTMWAWTPSESPSDDVPQVEVGMVNARAVHGGHIAPAARNRSLSKGSPKRRGEA